MTLQKCAYCRQEIEGEPVRRQGKLYCSEACAFEASTRCCSLCGSGNTVEASLRYSRSPSRLPPQQA